MYYLQSRYYDPEVGRFINADEAVVVQLTSCSALGTNIYLYCNNNVPSSIDSNGYISPANVLGALIGAGAGALIGSAIVNYFKLTGWKKWLVIAGSSALVAVAGWFAGPSIYNAIKTVLQKAVETGKIAVGRISASVSELLRLVNPKTIRFAKAAARHQNEVARQVPLKHLVEAIKYGKASPDSSSKAIMYTINNFWKNGNRYYLEVLYDWSSKTIYHFKYWRFK